MQPRSLLRAWKTGQLPRLLYGATLPPSTRSLGVESYIASLRATPASQTASPESAKAPTTTDGFSTTSSGSWPASGLLVSSEKTSAGTSTGKSVIWSRHWKNWATGLRLEFSQRARPGLVTSESDYSSWPTAAARDTRSPNSQESQEARNEGSKRGQQLMNYVEHCWPTPEERWSTPSAHDGRRPGPDLHSTQGRNLSRESATWETPSVAVTEGSRLTRGGDRSAELLLSGQAENLSRSHPCQSSPQDPPTQDGDKSSPTRRILNPLFVEWMHGWSIGWTDCANAVTGFQVWLLRSRGYLLTLASHKNEGDLF